MYLIFTLVNRIVDIEIIELRYLHLKSEGLKLQVDPCLKLNKIVVKQEIKVCLKIKIL